MRFAVRHSNRDVGERKSILAQLAQQSARLFEIWLCWIGAVHPKSVWIRETVICVQPTRNEDRRHLITYTQSYFYEESSTIFERPTVASLSGERGQQLGYQVSVASLDVDRVETGVGRELIDIWGLRVLVSVAADPVVTVVFAGDPHDIGSASFK